MTFAPDSALVTRVVPSLPEEVYSRRGYPIKAVLIHMAEGGGTDTHLLRPDGNSSHYVVKYDGAIVQMVPEAEASGSVRPDLMRASDDAPFLYGGESVTYGASARKTVFGTIEPRYVNRIIISIEIEGFAASGPNAAQRRRLVELVGDIRRRRASVRGLLGHRDCQSYKACPGRYIPWSLMGGHGVILSPPESSTEEPVVTTLIRELPFGGRFTIPAGKSVTGFRFDAGAGAVGEKLIWLAHPDPSEGPFDAYMTTTATRGNPFIRATDGFFRGYFLSATGLLIEELPAPPMTPSADVLAAEARGYERGRADLHREIAALS